MRKNIRLLMAVTALFAYYLSFYHVNHFNTNRVITVNYLYDPELMMQDQWVFHLTDDADTYDVIEFHANLNQMLIDSQLMAGKLSFGFDEDLNKSVAYSIYSTNAPNIEKRILLEKGYVDLNKGVIYSNDATEAVNRLLYHLDGDRQHEMSIIKLVPLTLDDTNRGKYNLYSLDGVDNLRNNVEQFQQLFNEKYPDVHYSLYQENPMYISDSSGYLYWITSTLKMDYKIIAVSSIFLAFLLCSKILSLRRQIAIMKIEGSSSESILVKLYLIPLLKYTGIFALGYLGIGLFYRNIYSIGVSIGFALLEYSCFFLAYLLVGVILLIVIDQIPEVSSEKGKNNLFGLYVVAYVLKCFVVVLVIYQMIQTLPNVQNLCLIQTRKDHAVEVLTNRYFFGKERNSSYFDDIGKDNYIALREDICSTNPIFHFGYGYLYENFNDLVPVYLGKPYDFEQLGLIDETIDYDRTIVVYLREGHEYENLDKILSYAKLTVFDQTIEIVTLTYNKDIQTYSPRELLFRDTIEDLPLVCIPEEPVFKGQVEASVIHYDGNLNEVQKFVDDKFHAYGYESAFTMSSMLETFNHIYLYQSGVYIKDLLYVIVLLAIYYLTNRFLVDTDILNNRQRYWITKVEGVAPYSIGIYLLRIASPLLIGSMYVAFKSQALQLLAMSSVLLMGIETLLFGWFLVRVNRIGGE